MAASKNPGLQARKGTVQAAIEASRTLEPAETGKRRSRQADDVVVTVSLPKAVHDELRRLQFEQRRPIHGMILAGIAMFLKSEGSAPEVLETLS